MYHLTPRATRLTILLYLGLALGVLLCLTGCTGGVSFGWGPDGYRHEAQSYRDIYVEHAQR